MNEEKKITLDEIKLNYMKFENGYSSIEVDNSASFIYFSIFNAWIIYLVDDWDLFLKHGRKENKNIQLYYVKKEENGIEKLYILIEQYEDEKLKWNGIFYFFYNDKVPVQPFNEDVVYLMFKEKYPQFCLAADEKQKIDLAKYSLEEKDFKPWGRRLINLDYEEIFGYQKNLTIQLSRMKYIGDELECTLVELEYKNWYYKFKVIFLSVNVMWVSFNDVIFMVLEHEKNKYKLDSFIILRNQIDDYSDIEDLFIKSQRKLHTVLPDGSAVNNVGLKYHLARILSVFGKDGNIFERYNDDAFLNSLTMKIYTEDKFSMAVEENK